MVPTTPDPGSVGVVQTRTARLFTPDSPLRLAGGATLPVVDVAYETYGRSRPRPTTRSWSATP